MQRKIERMRQGNEDFRKIREDAMPRDRLPVCQFDWPWGDLARHPHVG